MFRARNGSSAHANELPVVEFDDIEDRIKRRKQADYCNHLRGCKSHLSLGKTNQNSVCSSCQKDIGYAFKGESEGYFDKLKRNNIKSAKEGSIEGTLQKIKSMQSPFEGKVYGPYKTTGYRCGDGPSHYCNVKHYVPNYFLKWSPPAQLPLNQLLGDLKFSVDHKRLGFNAAKTFCNNSKLHTIGCSNYIAKPNMTACKSLRSTARSERFSAISYN